MVCTSCGKDSNWVASQGSTPSLSRADTPVLGWLKTARWVPARPGLATVAIGVAHNGLGTPAVIITRVLVNVVNNISVPKEDADQADRKDIEDQIRIASEADAKLWGSSMSLASDQMIYG